MRCPPDHKIEVTTYTRRRHNLPDFAVLIPGGRVQDSVVVITSCGTLDAVGVQGRKQGRSKYGAKRPKS